MWDLQIVEINRDMRERKNKEKFWAINSRLIRFWSFPGSRALRALSERLILQNFQSLTYRPIFDVVTTKQQSGWCIMVDISKTRINSLMVPNFVTKVEHTL